MELSRYFLLCVFTCSISHAMDSDKKLRMMSDFERLRSARIAAEKVKESHRPENVGNFVLPAVADTQGERNRDLMELSDQYSRQFENGYEHDPQYPGHRFESAYKRQPERVINPRNSGHRFETEYKRCAERADREEYVTKK